MIDRAAIVETHGAPHHIGGKESAELRPLTDAEVDAVNGGALGLVLGAAFGVGFVGAFAVDYAIRGDNSAIVKVTDWLEKVV